MTLLRRRFREITIVFMLNDMFRVPRCHDLYGMTHLLALTWQENRAWASCTIPHIAGRPCGRNQSKNNKFMMLLQTRIFPSVSSSIHSQTYRCSSCSLTYHSSHIGLLKTPVFTPSLRSPSNAKLPRRQRREKASASKVSCNAGKRTQRGLRTRHFLPKQGKT